MTVKEQEFVARFTEYMGPSRSAPTLADFIASLRFEDARACTSTYFTLDKDYAHARAKSLAVFLQLALRSLETGEVYFALRIDIMIRSKHTPWETHYRELIPKDKTALALRIASKTKSLTHVQREFIDVFDRYMHHKTSQNKVEKFTTDQTKFEQRRECLLTYLEISQGYVDGDKPPSVLIFYGVSRLTLWLGDAYFAHAYETNKSESGTVWQLRYAALETWQRQNIEQDISDKKTIRSDVTVKVDNKDKTFKNVPIGTYKGGAVSVESARPDDQHEAMPLTGVQKQFLALYQPYVEHGERKSIDKLQDFLRRQGPGDRQACVSAYLDDSQRRYSDSNQRSLNVFFGAVSMAIRGDAFYAFKVDLNIHTAGTIWARRFSALKDDQMRLRADIAAMGRRARVIDEVKSAYYARYRKDPDANVLLEFEPATNRPQEELLSKALSDCEVAIAVRDVDVFDNTFKALTEVLRDQNDRLTLVVLLKRCRDRQGLDRRFRHLFYLFGVGILFTKALNWHPEVYKAGMDTEERNWLLHGSEAGNRYFDDFVLQVEYAMWKRTAGAIGRKADEAPEPVTAPPTDSAPVPTLAAMCKAEGMLHIYADRFSMYLTPTLEAAALYGCVETLWEKKSDVIGALRVPITSRFDGPKEIRVGETLGNVYVLWWDSTRGVVYVQVKGLDRVVFEMRPERLGQVYDDDATWGAIARATEHLLELISFFFDIITYMPDLISGGLTGLVKGIAFNYLFDKSVEALGIDPTKTQVLLFGLGLLAHGARHHEVKGSIHQPDVSAVEHGAIERTAVEHTGVDRRASAAETGNRLTDSPSTDAVTHGANPSLESRTGIDMRGIDRDDGSLFTRGADPDVTHSTSPGSRTTDVPEGGTGAVKTGDRGTRRRVVTVESRKTDVDKGVAARGTDDVAAPGTPEPKRRPRKPRTSKTSVPQPPPSTPPPPSPNIQDRIPEGTWTNQGNVQINEGAFELTGAKKVEANLYPDTYENGIQQQVVPAMARRLSNKPVRSDVRPFVDLTGKKRGRSGYQSPSSAKTNRAKRQKMRQGAVLQGTPETTMEVVEQVGKGMDAVSEVHLWEATLEKDFKPRVGRAGHKQRQISGTARISTELPRKGYTPDTQIHYHIMAPERPKQSTIDFLNAVSAEMPNVNFTWWVVR